MQTPVVDKICHVNLARGFRGGERQTLLLIQALAEKGVKQALLARADSPLHQKLRGTMGLEHCYLSNTLFSGFFWLRRFQPKLVHAHDARAAQWAFLNYCLSKTPYMLTRRVPNPIGQNLFTRMVYRKAAVVAALSTAIEASIKRLQADRQVSIIPSMYASFVTDQAVVSKLKQQYKGSFVIGHIGALVDRHKGQSVLIEAARLLRTKYPDMRFIFLGQGEDEQTLRQQAADLDSVEFAGFVSDVGNWINIFDIFAFPSLNEGLGSTLLDVMQQSKPIVASAVDGILDVIHDGDNGLLVEKNNPQQLAAAIERLYLDVQLRERLGQTAKQDLVKYSPERISECYYKEYQQLISGDAGNTGAPSKV